MRTQSPPAAKPAPKVQAAHPKKLATKKLTTKSVAMQFALGEHVVYPAHGVGEVVDIARREMAGIKVDLLVVAFRHERMRLSVPLLKAGESGIRRLTSLKALEHVFERLRSKAKIRRAMWSRRAQEYEDKINSGDILLLAEVVRDLYRSPVQPEQSYSERQLFEAALLRLARELAAIEKTQLDAAREKLDSILLQAARERTGDDPLWLEVDRRAELAQFEALGLNQPPDPPQ